MSTKEDEAEDCPMQKLYEKRGRLSFVINHRSFTLVLCGLVIGLAALGWHLTPWSDMAWWGTFGCRAALNHGVWPKGCGKKPDPCCERCQRSPGGQW